MVKAPRPGRQRRHLKSRESDIDDEEATLKSAGRQCQCRNVIVENELLREKIGRRRTAALWCRGSRSYEPQRFDFQQPPVPCGTNFYPKTTPSGI
jgi:hypothetical protein